MTQHNRWRGWCRVALMGSLLAVMVGCGQKGALVLPPDAASTPTAPNPPALGAHPHD